MEKIVVRENGGGYFAAGLESGAESMIIGSSPEGALKNYAEWLLEDRRAWRLRYQYAKRNGGQTWPVCPVCGREYALHRHNMVEEAIITEAEQAAQEGPSWLLCVECCIDAVE